MAFYLNLPWLWMHCVAVVHHYVYVHEKVGLVVVLTGCHEL